MSHIVVWEFVIRSGSESDFERIYGPKGDWAQLFAQGEGYLGTELLRDAEKPGRYLVIDRWSSQEHYQRFCASHATEYKALDARCEALTVMECPHGWFSSLD